MHGSSGSLRFSFFELLSDLIALGERTGLNHVRKGFVGVCFKEWW